MYYYVALPPVLYHVVCMCPPPLPLLSPQSSQVSFAYEYHFILTLNLYVTFTESSTVALFTHTNYLRMSAIRSGSYVVLIYVVITLYSSVDLYLGT